MSQIHKVNASAAYKTYVNERFDGEVVGEALFRVMPDRCAVADHALKLRTLQQLERQTKEMLAVEVRLLGGTAAERAELVSKGESIGARLAGVAWPALMKRFRVELVRFVDAFERAEHLAAPGRETLLRAVTDHERALLEFVDRELAGRARE